jgi:putative phosphoesterase
LHKDEAMRRVGLLSDSHGRADTTERAVSLLLKQGADTLLHLGDIGSPEVLDALLAAPPGSSHPVPVQLVFGNTDDRYDELDRYARRLGLEIAHPMGWLTVDGRSLAFCHGHEPKRMNEALEWPASYLCHGHTHRAVDQQRGDTRVINPGALYRARQYSAALLDLASDRLTFLPVPPA